MDTQVRQYFVDENFYAADATARGFCDDGFLCETLSPSSATVKVRAQAVGWAIFATPLAPCSVAMLLAQFLLLLLLGVRDYFVGCLTFV